MIKYVISINHIIIVNEKNNDTASQAYLFTEDNKQDELDLFIKYKKNYLVLQP